MPFSKKLIEALLESVQRAGKDLRGKIGYLKIEKVKVGRSEIRIFCVVESSEGEKRVVVKYDGKKLWVEGPRWVSVPLKNRISYHFSHLNK